MFRRKDDENGTDTEEGATSSATTATSTESTGGSSAASSSAPVAAAPIAASPVTATRPVAEAPRPAATAASFRPTPPSARMADAPRSPLSASTPTSGPGSDKSSKGGRRILTVGNDILLKGEIATCDRLVIEGKVDATLNDVHTVEIAETGSFKGSASIEDAEISGLFEGELVVKNRLVIYSTGKVRGKITYGEIEIERGGELTGEIKMGNGAVKQKAA